MSMAISVRVPEKLVTELDDVAKETERSRSFHVQKAIEAYLEDYADLQIAVDRLRNLSDPVISFDEMRQQLGI